MSKNYSKVVILAWIITMVYGYIVGGIQFRNFDMGVIHINYLQLSANFLV